MFFVVVVALGGLGGAWLDQHFHRSPLFAIIGLALGLAAGIREMLKVLKETTASSSNPGRYPISAAPAKSAPREPSEPESDDEEEDQLGSSRRREEKLDD